MSKIIKMDPFTRIEGHLSVKVEASGGAVSEAYCSGEMFRGFEAILKGRDPMDAQQITQRICGVCPISHGLASVQAQEDAHSAAPPTNGRLARNLILAANYLMSHITHFYHLSALDFVDITAIAGYKGNDPALAHIREWVKSQIASKDVYPAAPFLPRYNGEYIQDPGLNIVAVKHYLDALELRAVCHKMLAVFGGKVPHSPALVPGGITEKITTDKIIAYESMLRKIYGFIETAYIPDVVEVANYFPGYFTVGKGCGNFLSYGVFHENDEGTERLLQPGVLINGKFAEFKERNITEDVMYSLFSSGSGLPPSRGETNPAPKKQDAYSWLKAPRYGDNVVEVGPLARLMVAYVGGDKKVATLIDAVLGKLNRKAGDLVSVLGRHAARALESKIVAERCFEWLSELEPGKPTFQPFDSNDSSTGVGLTEAPRGALGHWLKIEGGKIENYQCVVPTTWNCSPRDDKGRPGAVEQALVGTPVKDDESPIEAARVVRSFDPCIACAVH